MNWLLGVTLALAVGFDLAERRIPNWLTLGGAAAALLLALITAGLPGLREHLFGALVLGGIFFIFWKLGLVGGGDQKLMLAVGAAVGLPWVLTTLVGTAVAGALQAGGSLVLHWCAWRGPKPAAWRRRPLPYSLAILGGSLVSLVCQALGVSPLFW